MSSTLLKILLVFVSVFLILFFPFTTTAQCSSAGPRNATSSASVSFSGSNFGFTNVLNIFSSDNNRASSTGLAALFSGQTEYLRASNFGFSIPSTAIICGVVVEAEKSATGIGTVLGVGLSYVTDYSVRLVRNGVVLGNNKATATHWTGTESYHTYGSSNDIWGVAWTPADINSANFGIAFSASINGLVMLIPSVRLDHIRITVHYSVTILPVTVPHFKVTAKENNTALIEWKVDAEAKNVVYTPQRSRDGKNWENVDGNIQQAYMYTMEDKHPYSGESFYRLKMTEASGEVSYSAARAIRFRNTEILKVYPNPFTDRITISGNGRKENIRITDMSGRSIQVPASTAGTLDLHFLHPGSYLLHIGNKVEKIQKL